jgi:uncharacterized protein involved in response to NO
MRREPFRLLFPLGTVLSWVGVGHWIAYWAGWVGSYSCLGHGLVQIQGFLLAFALGFLLTAIPRRTQSAPPSAWLLVFVAAALSGVAVAAFSEAWIVAELLAIAVLVATMTFAIRRLALGGGARRPPAAFVLLPLGMLAGIGGAALLAWGTSAVGSPWALRAGRLLVTQGLFLCLVLGAGGLVLPLMAGAAPPPDLGSSPTEWRRAARLAAAGAVVLATLVAEASGSERAAPLVRASVVAIVLAGIVGRGDPGPGWNRRVARLAAWLVPAGLLASGLEPDYRVPALHVTFIGGFALLAFSVASHVTASHLDLPRLRDGRSPLVAGVAGAVLVAMLGRVTADATQTYFEHLASAGVVWIAGTAVWVAALLPRWLGRR